MWIGNLLKRSWKAAALVAAGAVGGGAAFAVASVPDGSGVIHACVNVTTTQGTVLPTQTGPNLRIIDTDAGQSCTLGPGAPANATTLSWDVTGPQGPQGVPGTTGAVGQAGAAGSQGVTGKGITNTFTVAPPLLTSRTAAVAEVTLGSGRGALSFPVLNYGQGSASTTGASGGSGRVTVHDISIVKKIDKTSPKLYLLCATGKHIKTATVTVRRAKASVPYLKISLSNVIISSDQTQDTPGKDSAPVEAISFNFTKVEYRYSQQ